MVSLRTFATSERCPHGMNTNSVNPVEVCIHGCFSLWLELGLSTLALMQAALTQVDHLWGQRAYGLTDLNNLYCLSLQDHMTLAGMRDHVTIVQTQSRSNVTVHRALVEVGASLVSHLA